MISWVNTVFSILIIHERNCKQIAQGKVVMFKFPREVNFFRFALCMEDRENRYLIHVFYYQGDGIFIDPSVNSIIFEVERSHRDIVLYLHSLSDNA